MPIISFWRLLTKIPGQWRVHCKDEDSITYARLPVSSQPTRIFEWGRWTEISGWLQVKGLLPNSIQCCEGNCMQSTSSLDAGRGKAMPRYVRKLSPNNFSVQITLALGCEGTLIWWNRSWLLQPIRDPFTCFYRQSSIGVTSRWTLHRTYYYSLLSHFWRPPCELAIASHH